ncbi:Fpg/Nei family DNA glycosylase [Kineosporia succinea]|uniref:DNA-(apurinic or apyrimidinic site) lyase n=1 Tax=Kineosporia succinea TaxID=84632 RepID=A0ABT9P4Z7_9ACTN|nr:DNA-formamidopyrimidine glycosylase family protein [Kineosporia succinea]MDP9827552.1 formamidopyrimidine-DNA glycosylase [Kineosporia succinea]
MAAPGGICCTRGHSREPQRRPQLHSRCTRTPETTLPEGHTIHRLAKNLDELFTGTVVRASAVQDKFAAGVAQLDGATVTGTDAWGKHLFVHASPAGGRPPLWLHVHLGLYGKFLHGKGSPAAPWGQLRLRLESERGWADLRGATASELLDASERQRVIDRLGADPLRKNADGDEPFERISRSRTAIGALLMDQKVIAGIGNVYRAEILFRHGIDPHRPGRGVTSDEWSLLWADLQVLMRAGVRSGKIVTTRPDDRPRGRRTAATVRREDSHYVYRRAGEACRRCGTPVATEAMVARNLYWCPKDQAY